MTNRVDAIVVGAGFAGLYMLHRLREAGLSARLIETGKDVGGVWYWNRYPGLCCDVESIDYQYQFSDEIERGWDWPERYSKGPVIQQYLSYVADTLDLRRDILFETTAKAATFEEDTHSWLVETDRGDTFRTSYFILAVGPLTSVNTPPFAGMEEFKGRLFHTARWPQEPVDFTGRRVGIIGTGSSGVQSIPVIAQEAASLTVFQRTAAFSLPAENRLLSAEEIRQKHGRFAKDREVRRASPGGLSWMLSSRSALEVSEEEREAEFERCWTLGGFAFLQSFRDILLSQEANDLAAEFVKRKIRAKVNDPETAAVLTSQTYPIGAKRPCLDTNYYETFNLPHVKLVDLRKAPLERFCAEGIVTGGKVHAFDDIVLATGFDAVTGAVLKLQITGKDGLSLGDLWSSGPQTYLGVAVAGFPNLFMIDGAQSPSIIVNAPLAIEQQVEWVGDCIEYMRRNGCTAIEATEQAQHEWVSHVGEVANYTLMVKADSWAIGANIPGKPRVYSFYLAGLDAYRNRCTAVAEGGYEGFRLEKAMGAVAA